MAFGNSIIARLGLDSRDFREGIGAARAALGGFATGAVGTVISGAAIKSVVEYGDHIQDLSERYRVNSTELQRMGGVAQKEGSNLEGVGRAYDKLAKNSDAALQGNKEMIDSFADLGITTEDLRNLKPEEIMLKIGNGSMHASDLIKVLGRSALELRPTLKKLADGTAEFSDAIDEIDIQKLSEANDKLEDIKASARVAAADILVTIGEGFNVVARDGRNLADDTQNVWSAAAGVVRNVFTGNMRAAAIEIRNLGEAEKRTLRDLYFARDQAKGSAEAGAGVGTEAGASAEVMRAKAKTRAELSAEQKERERTQLSLDELAEKGPGFADQNRSSLQAIYNAEQARKVKELEQQAHDQLYNQADFEGSRRTLDRADALRQTIPGLSETDKMIGAFRAAVDATGQARNIAIIAQEMVRED